MAESRMALEALYLRTLQENECFAKLKNLFIKIKIVLKFIYLFIQQTLESLLCPRPWEDKDKWDEASAAKFSQLGRQSRTSECNRTLGDWNTWKPQASQLLSDDSEKQQGKAS